MGIEKRSIEVEKEKANRFYNIIRHNADDIFGFPSNEDHIKLMGKIEGIVCIAIRERGIEKFGSTMINVGAYFVYLIEEIERVQGLIYLSKLTGQTDITELSKLLNKKYDEQFKKMKDKIEKGEI